MSGVSEKLAWVLCVPKPSCYGDPDGMEELPKEGKAAVWEERRRGGVPNKARARQVNMPLFRTWHVYWVNARVKGCIYKCSLTKYIFCNQINPLNPVAFFQIIAHHCLHDRKKSVSLWQRRFGSSLHYLGHYVTKSMCWQQQQFLTFTHLFLTVIA